MSTITQSFYHSHVMRRASITWGPQTNHCPNCDRDTMAVGSIKGEPIETACTGCGHHEEITP